MAFIYQHSLASRLGGRQSVLTLGHHLVRVLIHMGCRAPPQLGLFLLNGKVETSSPLGIGTYVCLLLLHRVLFRNRKVELGRDLARHVGGDLLRLHSLDQHTYGFYNNDVPDCTPA